MMRHFHLAPTEFSFEDLVVSPQLRGYTLTLCTAFSIFKKAAFIVLHNVRFILPFIIVAPPIIYPREVLGIY